MFFVFDGVDGSGKTTQLKRFAAWLESRNHDVVTCKDPGTTELGERLRALLLQSSDIPIHMRTEMMLFTTARTQLVEQIIRPALDSGKTVVLDRYILSTIVYQGHAGRLDPASIREVNHFATAGLQPDQTFLLDLPTEVAMQRLGDNLDRMESRGKEYFEKVRQGFQVESRRGTEPVFVVDANRSAELVEADIRAAALELLSARDASADASRRATEGGR